MLLAIDTSTRQIGIALYDGVRVLHESTWISNFYHTVELAPAIDRAFSRLDISQEDIKVLGVAVGPGSFTALRTGLAFAKGIALAWNLPIVSVSTLEFLVASQPLLEIPLVAVVEAGRKRLAVGWYEAQNGKWVRSGDIELFTPAELAKKMLRPTRICGEMDETTRIILKRRWKNVQLASPAASLRRPAFLAELAWERWQAGEVQDPVTLAPIYIAQVSS
jgi:tRNA threonylcarbamoyladenosine biosynthesis protein TsaB